MKIAAYANHSKQYDELLPKVAHLKGDCIEFGCYNGGSAQLLAERVPERKVYACDTFAGMPGTYYRKDVDHDHPGKFKPTIGGATPEDVAATAFDGYDNIVPVIGEFHKTLPTLSMPVVFAYIDCDLYWSYWDVLEWLSINAVDGAYFLIDDYGACKGAREATDEWMEQTGHQWVTKGSIICFDASLPKPRKPSKPNVTGI